MVKTSVLVLPGPMVSGINSLLKLIAVCANDEKETTIERTKVAKRKILRREYV